ncbi:MAG TPA: glycoside hydrolase family 71/99-like protein [Chthonomonadaceae bacterium]|nr:glycoside hydrolase family 71/99-like protein [Chthonomonadaceae bacterium]
MTVLSHLRKKVGLAAIVMGLLPALVLSACRAGQPAKGFQQAAAESGPSGQTRYVMAHYMPWFEASPNHNRWGWHWTMNHYRPDHLVDGHPEVASHYFPLIGLYDSNDPDLLECHAQLMKLAGIDGAIIDWYGTDNLYDYPQVHRNAQHLIAVLERAGLHFAICYEDQTVPKLIANHLLAPQDAVAHGQALLQWLQTHWFASPAYLRIDGRPVLLVFGGGYYRSDQWKQIFAPLPEPPLLFTELGRRDPAIGGFGWPVPDGGTAKSEQELDSFYRRAKDWPRFIPAAYPRFHDIYAEAGVGKSWGSIEDRDGKTYTQTLERALLSRASIVQLVTWNDWGEGTMIEPSVEYGYRDLEITQRLRRKRADPAFAYTAQDLRLPIQLYLQRKKAHGDPARRAKLDKVSQLLFAGHIDRAKVLLKGY